MTVSFDNLILRDGSPIYLQLMEYLKEGIASSVIRNGDELPSRRVLSALLGVNPNTVQRAYRELEEEGVIESRTGAKSYIRLGTASAEKYRYELLEGRLRAMIAGLKQLGVDKGEAEALMEKLWGGE